MELNGRRVLVTGASRGIGERIARAAAGAGADVALVARPSERLDKVAFDLGARAYPTDLGDTAQVLGLVERVEADGPVDVLVNNAAVDAAGRFTTMPPAEIAQVLQVNLLAAMLLCRQALPGMLARGRGHIVNISSLGGTNAVPGIVPYSSSKAGLSHFTGCLRGELKGLPVRTTLVELGPVSSEMMDRLRGHGPAQRCLRRLELLRVAVDLDADEVADAVVDAVRRDRRHLRMPRRDVVFPLLVEAPRRITEWLLAGVDVQAD